MAGGRPTKYRPSMCKVAIDLMSEGASKFEVAAAIDVCIDTISEWQKEENNPAFSAAIKQGERLSRAWWEKHGRKNLDNKEFNSTLWYMNMKNRHAWADKQETAVTGKGGGAVELKWVVEGIDAAPADSK